MRVTTEEGKIADLINGQLIYLTDQQILEEKGIVKKKEIKVKVVKNEPIILEKKQQEALDAALRGENIFISGKSGSGKSLVTKEIIKAFQKKKVPIAILSSTGISASLVGGSTIYSFFGLYPDGVFTENKVKQVKEDKIKLWKRTKCIIIDEVSMVRADLFDMMFWTLLGNGIELDDKQIIIVGDLKQLSAVLKLDEKPYFKYEKNDFRVSDYYSTLNIKEIELDVVKRQSDPEFIEALNKVRDKIPTDYFKQFENLPEKGIHIAATNRLVNIRNQSELEKLEGNSYVYEAEVSQNFNSKDFIAEKTLILKENCKVMYIKNCQNSGAVNGDIGEFRIKIHEGKPVPYFFSNRLNIWIGLSPYKFETKEYKLIKGFPTVVTKSYIEQLPIRLCYSLSIHKTQGQSFDELTLDKTDTLFDPQMEYVALSRVRTPQGLSIIPKK